jgi:PII-like signaling protein
VYRGIAGYGANGLPIMLSVIDEEAKIRAYLPVLEQMIDNGLVVLSDADVIKYTHRLNAPLSREPES